jgi:GAF domain-containing protein
VRAATPGEPPVRPDVAEGLRRLCTAARGELDLLGASVTLMTSSGQIGLVALSDGWGGPLEELQFDTGEGPTRDAFASGRPVLVSDLSAELGRWPGFASTALESGYAAVFTLPLQLGAVRFGVLTLADAAPRTLTKDEVSASLIYAEIATEVLLDSSLDGEHPDPDLVRAVHRRDEVYQAQGMVMVDLGVTLAVALAFMRAAAFAESLSLHTLATEIVDGRRLTDPREA